MATAYGLCAIPNPAVHIEHTGFLGPPRNPMHTAERCWAIYILDWRISFGSALLRGVSPEEREVHLPPHSSMHMLIVPVDYHYRLAEVSGQLESSAHLASVKY